MCVVGGECALVCVVMVLADSIHALPHQDTQQEHTSSNTSAVKQQNTQNTHTQINIHTQRYIHRNTYGTYTTHTHTRSPSYHDLFQSRPVFIEFNEVSIGGSDVREEVM